VNGHFVCVVPEAHPLAMRLSHRVIDQFTVADGAIPGIKVIENRGSPLSRVGSSKGGRFAECVGDDLYSVQRLKLGRNASASGRQKSINSMLRVPAKNGNRRDHPSGLRSLQQDQGPRRPGP